MEVVTYYHQEYVLKKRHKFRALNIIPNKLKQGQNIFHLVVNANSIKQLAIQTKNGILKHVNMSVKIIVHAKEIIVGTLRMASI